MTGGEELFELELIGGDVLRRYRQMRPEVEAMPWGTLSPDDFPPEVVVAARVAWTGASFQEHRTGAACAATLQALIAARAPLDLVALATRFPLDEIVHVELCSRMAMELGGAVKLTHDPRRLIEPIAMDAAPLVHAAHLVVAFFCVGEALSIPLLQGTWRAARHPLPKAVLHRIVRDEADHGTFGWTFLDWAGPHLGPDDRAALGLTADAAIRGVHRSWQAIENRPRSADPYAPDLGWMRTDAYLALARRSLARQVVAPLRERGIPVGAG